MLQTCIVTIRILGFSQKDDSYDNLTLILPEVHKLIHATNKNTINKYITMLQLTTSQVTKVNKLRKLVGNDKI